MVGSTKGAIPGFVLWPAPSWLPDGGASWPAPVSGYVSFTDMVTCSLSNTVPLSATTSNVYELPPCVSFGVQMNFPAEFIVAPAGGSDPRRYVVPSWLPPSRLAENLSATFSSADMSSIGMMLILAGSGDAYVWFEAPLMPAEFMA